MSALNCLEMRNISLAFGGFAALTQVDFFAEGDSVHALTGANSAGKSTLMAVLSGAHSHYSSEILLDGASVDTQPARREMARHSSGTAGGGRRAGAAAQRSGKHPAGSASRAGPRLPLGAPFAVSRAPCWRRSTSASASTGWWNAAP